MLSKSIVDTFINYVFIFTIYLVNHYSVFLLGLLCIFFYCIVIFSVLLMRCLYFFWFGKIHMFRFQLDFYCFSPKYFFFVCSMIRKFVVRLLKYPVQKGETMNLFWDFQTIFTSSSSHLLYCSIFIIHMKYQKTVCEDNIIKCALSCRH